MRPTELVAGNCYFSVGYADHDLAVPLIQTLVYLEPEEDPENGRRLWTFREGSSSGLAAHEVEEDDVRVVFPETRESHVPGDLRHASGRYVDLPVQVRYIGAWRSSKGLKLAKPGAIGAPQLIPGAGRREREGVMGLLTADMKRVVGEQRLGFVATVCPNGTPNLSPKGTTTVWDDDHLVFANIRSPGTVANLRQNASVEVNVVDPLVRKGYRFKGVASILESGPLYDKAIAFYKERGVTSAIREVVLVRVQSAKPLESPAYDLGLTEDEVRARWELYWQSLRAGRTSPTGE